MAIFVFSEIFIKIRMYQASETGSTLRITYYTAEFSMSNFSVTIFGPGLMAVVNLRGLTRISCDQPAVPRT